MDPLKRYALFFSFALILLVSFGCGWQEAPAAPEPPEQPSPAEPAPTEPEPSWDADILPFDPAGFTREQMLEDYDFLWDTILENCPLMDGFARQSGNNLEEIRLKGQAKVEALQDGDAAGFEEAISYLGGYFRGMGHLTNVSAFVYYSVRDKDAYESETHKQVYLLPQVQSYYKWASTLPKFESQRKSQAANSSNAPQQGGLEGLEASQRQDVPILRLKTFQFGPQGQGQAIQQIQRFCLDNLDAPHIVLDIRGNSGGSTAVWEQGLEPLFAGKVLEEQFFAAYRDTPLNRQMWDGWPENQPEAKTFAPDQLPEMLPNASGLVMEDLSQADVAAQRRIQFYYIDLQNPGGKTFEGRLWLLIDSSNYSAAEALIQRLQGCDFVALVGAPTRGGGMIFAAPAKIPFALPNSGMLYQYAPFYCMNPDGSCNEFGGAKPDIDAGREDALEVCLREIAKEEDNF